MTEPHVAVLGAGIVGVGGIFVVGAGGSGGEQHEHAEDAGQASGHHVPPGVWASDETGVGSSTGFGRNGRRTVRMKKNIVGTM